MDWKYNEAVICRPNQANQQQEAGKVEISDRLHQTERCL